MCLKIAEFALALANDPRRGLIGPPQEAAPSPPSLPPPASATPPRPPAPRANGVNTDTARKYNQALDLHNTSVSSHLHRGGAPPKRPPRPLCPAGRQGTWAGATLTPRRTSGSSADSSALRSLYRGTWACKQSPARVSNTADCTRSAPPLRGGGLTARILPLHSEGGGGKGIIRNSAEDD